MGLDQLAEIWLTHRLLAGTAIWKKLIRTIFLQQRKKILLIGGTDKGKSTLAVHIINTAVKDGYKTAIIDADIGQGDLAPPNAIGAAYCYQTSNGLTRCRCPIVSVCGKYKPYGIGRDSYPVSNKLHEATIGMFRHLHNQHRRICRKVWDSLQDKARQRTAAKPNYLPRGSLCFSFNQIKLHFHTCNVFKVT